MVGWAHFGGPEQSKKAGWVNGYAQRGRLRDFDGFDVSHLSALSGSV